MKHISAISFRDFFIKYFVIGNMIVGIISLILARFVKFIGAPYEVRNLFAPIFLFYAIFSLYLLYKKSGQSEYFSPKAVRVLIGGYFIFSIAFFFLTSSFSLFQFLGKFFFRVLIGENPYTIFYALNPDYY